MKRRKKKLFFFSYVIAKFCQCFEINTTLNVHSCFSKKQKTKRKKLNGWAWILLGRVVLLTSLKYTNKPPLPPKLFSVVANSLDLSSIFFFFLIYDAHIFNFFKKTIIIHFSFSLFFWANFTYSWKAGIFEFYGERIVITKSQKIYHPHNYLRGRWVRT